MRFHPSKISSFLIRINSNSIAVQWLQNFLRVLLVLKCDSIKLGKRELFVITVLFQKYIASTNLILVRQSFFNINEGIESQ